MCVTYTTVSTVCASSLLGSLVDLDVLDDQVAGVEAFGVGVGLGVAEETEEKLGGLDGPASAGDTELLAFITINVSSQTPRLVQHFLSQALTLRLRERTDLHSPCALRPVLPAYLLIGTASVCPITFSR